MNNDTVNTEFDEYFLNLDFYQRMPQMLPWVGSSYGNKYKRVLFVGESHYLPYESLIHKDLLQWYNLEKRELDENEVLFTNTRDVITKHHSENGIWKNPADIMRRNNILPPEGSTNIYEHFAFYNFFLRPAKNAGEIEIVSKDIEISNSIFRDVIKILKPSIIIFLSSKAWNYCQKDDIHEIDFDFTPHPSSQWWNRKAMKYVYKSNECLTGSQKFDKLVKDKLLDISIN